MDAKYDSIGLDYANLRRPDPRIAKAIRAALGDARSVLNVGAGAGSYEPEDLDVTPLEPSQAMIDQHPHRERVVQSTADNLPFGDNSFDASMALLTVHHWPDKRAGLHEMQRVTRDRIVLLTFDPDFHDIWLLDYLPELAELDAQQMPRMADYSSWLGKHSVTPIMIPHDCSDGFLYAYWRRPAAYLDPQLRKGSSSFWAIDGVEAKLERLRADLESGEWQHRYGHLLECEELDLGYRLVVVEL
jgi:SAM-dependent methyltransferase